MLNSLPKFYYFAGVIRFTFTVERPLHTCKERINEFNVRSSMKYAYEANLSVRKNLFIFSIIEFGLRRSDTTVFINGRLQSIGENTFVSGTAYPVLRRFLLIITIIGFLLLSLGGMLQRQNRLDILSLALLIFMIILIYTLVSVVRESLVRRKIIINLLREVLNE